MFFEARNSHPMQMNWLKNYINLIFQPKPAVNRNTFKKDLNSVIFLMICSPGADSEKLDFVAPLEEHRFYGILCFFVSPASILKTLPFSKCVRKTL